MTDENNKKSALNIIGVGPGDPELITIKAINTLKSSNFIFYPKVSYTDNSYALDIVKNYITFSENQLIPLEIEMKKGSGKNKEFYEENAKKIILKLKENFICSYITIGDPAFYSTYAGIYNAIMKLSIFEKLDIEINIIPGIPSLNYSLSLIKEPYIIKNSSVLITVPVKKDKYEIKSEIKFLYEKKERPQTIVFMKAGGSIKNILEVFKNLYYNEFKTGKLKLYLIEKSEIVDNFYKEDLSVGEKEQFDYFSILIAVFL